MKKISVTLIFVAFFIIGCDSLRFAPSQQQKQNAWLHSRTTARNQWIADRLRMGCASNLSAYVRSVAHGELPGAAALRNKLEKNRKTSTLFDTPRFVRNLESAFRTARDIFLMGQRARQIDVAESSL